MSIPCELLERIAERAHDPMRRTYMSGAVATAQAVDFKQMHADLSSYADSQIQAEFGRVVEAFGGMGAAAKYMAGRMMVGSQGMFIYRDEGTPCGLQPLAPPPSTEAIEAAEESIGRPLPNELKQLYAIGNGGFGPGDYGLPSLDELVRGYREKIGAPSGPKGQPWPEDLLPLIEGHPTLLCVNMNSGEIVYWSPDAIDDLDSDEEWERSFRPEAGSSLGDLMQHWVDAPTFYEDCAT